MNRAVAWHPACSIDDIGPEGLLRIDGPPPVTVIRLDDDLFAVADTCTHGEASLAEGWLDGDELVCPWHMGRFCPRTGQARRFPASKPLATFPVRVEDGLVFIELEETP